MKIICKLSEEERWPRRRKKRPQRERATNMGAYGKKRGGLGADPRALADLLCFHIDRYIIEIAMNPSERASARAWEVFREALSDFHYPLKFSERNVEVRWTAPSVPLPRPMWASMPPYFSIYLWKVVAVRCDGGKCVDSLRSSCWAFEDFCCNSETDFARGILYHINYRYYYWQRNRRLLTAVASRS